jgi:hypothetical protein
MIAFTENLWQEDWLQYHKTIFDGINKLIIVSENAVDISIKEDVYSSWKEWMTLRDHGKFLPAIRVVGGDPLGGGSFSGDIYFLQNGWKMVVDLNKNRISGILYSDDFDTPYYDADLDSLYAAKVSSLVNTYTTQIPVVTGDLSTITIPTALQNAMAVRQELLLELSRIDASISSIVSSVPSAIQNATAVRNNLATELSNISDLAKESGLVTGVPSVITETGLSAGSVNKTFTKSGTTVTINRV